MNAGRVEFSEKKDQDGEIEVSIMYGGEEVYAWLDEEDANNIINHLKKVFNID